ncbi:uncharacterized protein N7459_001921, partial [Penicillium hispanicum]|uniref:uncharacterized protein n=1 Tax=Penicillium hispanicum TaxID=1080232 RepID=UPI002540DE51
GYPGYSRPSLPDRLFLAAYDHDPSTSDCDGCDHSKIVPRSKRISDDIQIHYGAIASGNQVMKSGIARDHVARQLDVICFEMESAGLMEIFPCLPIRGISNYSDSHKNDAWQMYAAATAAAYARELLEELPVTEPLLRIARKTYLCHCVSHDHRQCLLDSLQFERINTRKSTIKAAYARTCQWFLCHPDYQAWLDSRKLMQHHGFLWITGKPGAGKSTIMKFAYSSMRKARHNNMLAASFFFNARGEYMERSSIGMYRSLLFQLLQGHPDLQTLLEDPEIVYEGQNNWPCLDVLKNIFCDAVFALGERSFTCFIDALDECDEQQVVDVVQYFEDLAESSMANGISFRVCFSSQHYPYFATRRGIRLTLEDQPGHEKDVETYIAGRLRIEDSTVVEELRPQILAKAAGVFTWVVLLVGILNDQGRTGMALRMRLAEIQVDGNKYEPQLPLSWTTQEDRAEMTRLSLPTRVIGRIQDERRTPLSRASELGYEAVVRTLIDNGADVNARDSYGSTPLLYALNNGHLETARLLIDNGADTPLYSASQSGDEVAVRLLIAGGADVNAGVEFGLTPISKRPRGNSEASY